MPRTGRPRVPGESVYVRLDPAVAEKLNKKVEELKDLKVSKTSIINAALKSYLGSDVKMKTWETELVTVEEVAFDHDLHAFEVYNKDGELLGGIYPNDIDAMESIIADLDDGSCPIAEGWEDGNGNTCTLDGWGK